MSQPKLFLCKIIGVMALLFLPAVLRLFRSFEIDDVIIGVIILVPLIGVIGRALKGQPLKLPAMPRPTPVNNDVPFKDVIDYFARFAMPAFGVFILTNTSSPFLMNGVPYVDDVYEPFLFVPFVIYGLIAILRKNYGPRRAPVVDGPITSVSADYGWPIRIAYIASGLACGTVVLLLLNAMISSEDIFAGFPSGGFSLTDIDAPMATISNK